MAPDTQRRRKTSKKQDGTDYLTFGPLRSTQASTYPPVRKTPYRRTCPGLARSNAPRCPLQPGRALDHYHRRHPHLHSPRPQLHPSMIRLRPPPLLPVLFLLRHDHYSHRFETVESQGHTFSGCFHKMHMEISDRGGREWMMKSAITTRKGDDCVANHSRVVGDGEVYPRGRCCKH